MQSDTIYAISTGMGRAAVAVVRISGMHASVVVDRMCRKVVRPRVATVASIFDPQTDELLDSGLVLWFPGPASFSGEDCVELHVHGGRAVVLSVLRALGSLTGFRPAFAGEFTRRAFLNGKMDLTSVEGLADLINAETDKQRQQALFFATGGTRHKVDEWRESLVQIAAIFAALIDFSDEGDVGNFTLIEDAKEGLIRLRNEMEGALVDEQQAEIVRDGYSVAIVGPPNAGKSSLLNALIKRDAAIVSAVPGTTRDIIEVTLDLNGVAVTLIDTAGLREVDDPVEAIGIERARASVRRADLVLWLCSAECLVLPTEISDDCSAVVLVANKCDLIGGADRDAAWTYISALTGFGIHGVLASIAEHASRAVKKDTPAFLGNARQAALIRGSVQELVFAESSMGEVEIAAEAIRRVLNLLEEVLGGVDVETVLGRVFSRFCIGK